MSIFNTPKKTQLDELNWRNKIWDWADKFQLPNEDIPRNINDLDDLASLAIDTTYPYIGYYVNCDKLPDDYYSTPLYHMKEIPEELSNLVNLEDVYLNNVGATKFINNLSKLAKLKYLDTFATGITTLPSDIHKLQKLESLYVWESEMTSVTEAICELKNLKHLMLASRKLEALPKNLHKLQNLEDITIRSDVIKEIPDSVFDIPNLKLLHISADNITTISPRISNLKSLESLTLFGDSIKSLPETISQLPNLNFIKTNSHIQQLLPNNINLEKIELMIV